MLLIDLIDSKLPQTQCKRCNYKDCKSYAKALVDKKAEINKCKTGGQKVMQSLAKLLNKKISSFNQTDEEYSIATIKEDLCIGCMKCIEVCPVDAIIGTKKMMHSVISQECTGCKLCLKSCPMDCIYMTPSSYFRDKCQSNHYQEIQRKIFKNRYKEKKLRKAKKIYLQNKKYKKYNVLENTKIKQNERKKFIKNACQRYKEKINSL